MVLCLNVVNLTIMLCIFFPVSLSVYVGPMQSGISASDSFMILITFSRTFSDFSLTLCLNLQCGGKPFYLTAPIHQIFYRGHASLYSHDSTIK